PGSDAYEVALPQIADALEEAGRLAPLGIFIDDYHWAPPDGSTLLMAALRVVETPLCFVTSARLRSLDEEPAASLPEPTADLWVEHLEVRGLDAEATTALSREVLGGSPLPSLADAIYARTLGNPLFVGET